MLCLHMAKPIHPNLRSCLIIRCQRVQADWWCTLAAYMSDLQFKHLFWFFFLNFEGELLPPRSLLRVLSTTSREPWIQVLHLENQCIWCFVFCFLNLPQKPNNKKNLKKNHSKLTLSVFMLSVPHSSRSQLQARLVLRLWALYQLEVSRSLQFRCLHCDQHCFMPPFQRVLALEVVVPNLCMSERKCTEP